MYNIFELLIRIVLFSYSGPSKLHDAPKTKLKVTLYKDGVTSIDTSDTEKKSVDHSQEASIEPEIEYINLQQVQSKSALQQVETAALVHSDASNTPKTLQSAVDRPPTPTMPRSRSNSTSESTNSQQQIMVERKISLDDTLDDSVDENFSNKSKISQTGIIEVVSTKVKVAGESNEPVTSLDSQVEYDKLINKANNLINGNACDSEDSSSEIIDQSDKRDSVDGEALNGKDDDGVFLVQLTRRNGGFGLGLIDGMVSGMISFCLFF